MDLPDGPPGAEGYQDSVVEIPKRTKHEDGTTKAEQEFMDYVGRLFIKAENNTQRPMLERLSRHSSGYLIYLCYPCGAVCVGENVMQTHLIGKKHKAKLESKTVWPLSIFDKSQYLQNDGEPVKKVKTKEVDDEADSKYKKYKNMVCAIQPAVDEVVAPLVGVEYMIEFPPEIDMRECHYYCALCAKHGQPKTILNHISSFWHRSAYMKRHFQSAYRLLLPYVNKVGYRYGVRDVVDRLAQCVDDTYGRMKPLQIDEIEFNADKDRICQWINKSYHFSEQDGKSFEEVIDKDLIVTHLITTPRDIKTEKGEGATGTGRAMSTEPISDDSGEEHDKTRPNTSNKAKLPSHTSRYEPYKKRAPAVKTNFVSHAENNFEKKAAAKLEHKRALTQKMIALAEENAKKTLVYHEKNPEKHPLYPEEWKKFWNKRYKELQTEGRDATSYDYKPEWIVYWTSRMKDLNDDELQRATKEIYRRMCLSPPKDPEEIARERKVWSPERRSSPERRWSSERRRSPDRRRPLYQNRRSPQRGTYHKRPWEHHRKSPTRELRTRSRSSSRRKQSELHRRRVSPPKYRANPVPVHRSRSPLSLREGATRNMSPESFKTKPPSLQTVVISDEELPADKFSSWKSDSGESLGSLPDAKSPEYRRARTGSCTSRTSRNRAPVMAPEDLGAADNVVATLRLLVALEDYLGSLGPKIVDLLTEALKMEKVKANSSEEMLSSERCLTLLETVKEKLKGASQAGLVSAGAVAAVRTAVVRTAALLHEADRRAAINKPDKTITPTACKNSLPVAGVGSIDKAEIAQQIAAALVAQGKTDVSSEELAALVDAVVGMAEEKKRTVTEVKKEPPIVVQPIQETTSVLQSNTESTNKQGTALQLLQTAYDEYDKKVVTEEVTSVSAHPMNDLSDGDLETLLKNFNELSAEEQHSLIGYLKKLETQDPRRVERLRDYIDTAEPPTEPAGTVTPAPPPPPDTPRAPTPAKSPSPPPPQIVNIESDDDDYNVEEVFKSATQKVREDQMRQEMEIVKKSLQEAKDTSSAILDLEKEPMKAVDLLAMVQASVQPLTTNRQVTIAPTTVCVPSDVAPSVVDTNVMPKSYGDPFPLARNNTMNATQQATGNMSPMIPNVGNRNVSPQNQFYNDDWNEIQNIDARPPIDDQWIARQNIPERNDDQWVARQNNPERNDDQWVARQNNPELNDDQWIARQNNPESNDDQWVARQNNPERNDDQWIARQNNPEPNDDQWIARQNNPERNDDQWVARQNNPERNDDQWVARQNNSERNDDQWVAGQNNPEPNDDQWVARQNIPDRNPIGRGRPWQPQPRPTPSLLNRPFPIWKPNIRMQDNANDSFSNDSESNSFRRSNQWEPEQDNVPNSGPWNARQPNKPEFNRFNQGSNFNFKGGQGGNDFAGDVPADNVPNRNNQFQNNFRPHQRGRGGFRGGNRRGRGGRGGRF